MNMFDLLEMLADWRAATKRVPNGDLLKSLEINRVRFEIPPDLYRLLVLTCAHFGWIPEGSGGRDA